MSSVRYKPHAARGGERSELSVIEVHHSQSSMDHDKRSINPSESWSGGRRGCWCGCWSGGRRGESSQQHSQGVDEKQCDHSDDSFKSEHRDHSDDSSPDSSGSEQQDGGSGIVIQSMHEVIQSMDELSDAMKLGILSQVKGIYLHDQDIGSGHFTIAEALGSGQMSALEGLWLMRTRLEGDLSKAIGSALNLGSFPSLTSIGFRWNNLGATGVEALGCAIRSGNLEKLERLYLWDSGIDDNDLATLASAFLHGEASVLPNLRELILSNNRFTAEGLQSLAKALISGRLNSLTSLHLNSFLSKPSEEGANALVSAFALNNYLTVVVVFDWYRFPDLDRRQLQLRQRNMENKHILAGLLDSPMVPAAFGKVFLCGSPMVGKTTLSHTLQRGFWEALFTWQRKRHEETRTRGIEVSHLCSKGTKNQNQNPITLLVWDMAGQEDYHLVHNAFFPDLSFSEGKATTFVIVCNSKSLQDAVQQLEYWLQYIASSCHKTTPRLRHVFVVLNNLGGQKAGHGDEQHWVRVLQHQRDKFSGFLSVHTDSFVMDVRRRGEVVGFKKCLLEHSKRLLNDEKVPAICQAIELNLLAWSAGKKEFPVLEWEEYVQEVHRLIAPWQEKVIEAATKYLSEAGVLIYIDKSFPSQWGIAYRRLVVLDVNWFCTEIVGNIFLSEDMVNQRDHPFLFRKRVNGTTGSVSISDFKKFFESRWNDQEFEHLIAILVWLGLCYKRKDENVYIPSLIDRNVEAGDPWQSQNAHEDGDEQWVMGFSIEHKKSEMTLAPMSLWYRFQVALAQTREFNGEVPDNDFVAGKNFTTFTFDYMNVLIEVDAAENIPTFHQISIFAKPRSSKKDELDGHDRKQRQVDLANSLSDILLRLWDDTCGGVEYVRKVVWPWPSSQSRPEYTVDRNREVSVVKTSVQLHGMGRQMQWTVGNGSSIITEDQLLSTNDKRNVIKSMESDISSLRERMREAVNLRIYPPQLLEDSSVPTEAINVAIHPTNVLTEGLSSEEAVSNGIQDATHRILTAVQEVRDEVREVRTDIGEVLKVVNGVDNMIRERFTRVSNEQNKVFRKLQETQRFFQEDKNRACPNLIYLGETDSGAWATLKQALSPSVYVRLKFACEAKYNNYRPHFVTDQQGVDVSALRPYLKKIAPWLKVSLTVLSVTAKVGANFVAPGMGLIVPDFQQWQQTSSLLEGIQWATGFQKAELDKLMVEAMGLDSNEALWNPRDVYGKSREAITKLIGRLSPEDYEQKFGLRKVCLRYRDGSLHGIVWICTECLKNFGHSDLVSEV